MECFINAYVHSVQNLTGSVKGKMGSGPLDSVCSTNRWAWQPWRLTPCYFKSVRSSTSGGRKAKG